MLETRKMGVLYRVHHTRGTCFIAVATNITKKKKKRQKEVKNATSCDIYYFEFLSPIVYWVTNMGTWAGNSHLFPSESFMNCVRLKLISQCCLGESDVDSGNAAKYRLKWADQ